MREILFRGKRKDNEEWVKGHLGIEVGNQLVIEYCDFDDILDEYCVKERFIIPETVGQYTGLCDKNGTRIFEGDIIKVLLSGNPQPIGVVKYGVTGICGFCVMTERGYSNYVLDKSEYFEVIGNIHDDPELLEA